MTQKDLHKIHQELEAKRDARKTKLGHLNWSVRKRAEIENSLCQIYGYVLYNPPGQLYTTHVLDHCIAAAFSLWRAVFLADKAGDILDYRTAIEDFLEKVVTTNAISFADDQRSSVFSVGFYLENAKHRLRTAAEVAAEYLDFQERDLALRLLQLRSSGEIEHTRYEWECVHLALAKVFNVIAAQKFLLPLIPPTALEGESLYIGGDASVMGPGDPDTAS